MAGSSSTRVAVLALVIAGGVVLRWVHLGTPSLWWDEVVEIATARLPSLDEVVRTVRHGVVPGTGNAGAMPLDYVLLHAWLAVAPSPAPHHLEIHVRFPAFVWSVLALVVFAGFAWRHLDRDVGIVALLLLAVSIPHVLYAAEARSYSLLVLVTVAHVWCFARVLDELSTSRWLAWLVVACASVLTGILSVIPLAAELAVLMLRSERRAVLIAVALPLAVLIAWLVAPSLGGTYGRPPESRPGVLATSASVFRFLAWDDAVLLGAFIAGAFVGARRPLTAALALGVVGVPVVALMAEAATYYVHPRHLIFLVPAFVVLAATGLVEGARRVVGLRWTVPAVVVVVAAAQGPALARFVAEPMPFFARTKTVHEMRGIVAPLVDVPAGERRLLLAERRSVPNAVLAFYIRAWGVADRVVFRGTRDVTGALAYLADPAAPLLRLAVPPIATVPVGLTPNLRDLLGIAVDVVPPRAVSGATIVAWQPPDSASMPPVRRFPGAWVFERTTR